jgi:hypothetical protein
VVAVVAVTFAFAVGFLFFLVGDLSFARLRHFGNLYALVVLDYALVLLDCALAVLALTLYRVFYGAFVTYYDILNKLVIEFYRLCTIYVWMCERVLMAIICSILSVEFQFRF